MDEDAAKGVSRMIAVEAFAEFDENDLGQQGAHHIVYDLAQVLAALPEPTTVCAIATGRGQSNGYLLTKRSLIAVALTVDPITDERREVALRVETRALPLVSDQWLTELDTTSVADVNDGYGPGFETNWRFCLANAEPIVISGHFLRNDEWRDPTEKFARQLAGLLDAWPSESGAA